MPAPLTAEMIEQLRNTYPPQHDGKRFHVRTLNGGWQVYGHGLLHVCECTRPEVADLIAAALEDAPRLADLERLREAVERHRKVVGPWTSKEGKEVEAALAKITTTTTPTGEPKCN